MDRRISRTVRSLLAAVLACLLLGPSGPALAQVSSPTAESDSLYVDPTNRFAVPVPTNWVAEEHDGYVRVVTSDDKIWVAAAIVKAEGATPGIDAFMHLLDEEFESSALDELLATPTTQIDSSALYTFDDGSESGQLLQGLGRKIGENEVFVLVLQGDLETVKLRQVQVDKIFDGILIRTEASASPVASPVS